MNWAEWLLIITVGVWLGNAVLPWIIRTVSNKIKGK